MIPGGGLLNASQEYRILREKKKIQKHQMNAMAPDDILSSYEVKRLVCSETEDYLQHYYLSIQVQSNRLTLWDFNISSEDTI